VVPFLQWAQPSWHGRGYGRTATGRVLAVGASWVRARQDAEAERLWQRHRERWHDVPNHRPTYREPRQRKG
jgi:hypothetical protein